MQALGLQVVVQLQAVLQPVTLFQLQSVISCKLRVNSMLQLGCRL